MTTLIDLGKLRFYWAGVYSPTTEYELNDVVKYGGNVYCYINVAKTIGITPTNSTYWALMVEGLNFTGDWNSATQYYIGDGVAYGGNVYIAIQNSLNQNPFSSPAYWSTFVEGIQYEGNYASGTTYQPNDVVTYGANLYVAILPTTGNVPTNTTYWTTFLTTIRPRGDWTTVTEYFINDVVTYGGNTYICLIQNTSTVFATDLAAGKWQVFNGGVRWRNTWTPSTVYLTNDLVRNLTSTYIATQDFTSGANFNTEFAAGKWEYFAQGSDVFPPLLPGDEGKALVIDSAGAALEWAGATASTNVFYVSPDGSDTNNGKNLNQAFATIKAACLAAAATGQPSTVFVKTGSYSEIGLPIVVPPNTAVVGDNQRTVTVTPGPGLAADGVTPNNQATMWSMSNGSILNKMTFTGMTGWVPGSTASNITTSTPRGIYVALNPASPVTTKSPYVLECAAIGGAGIGALVDGTAQATGNKSMLFHGYTIIVDNGVGFWVKDGGRAEIVSCFTYYAYFGYSSSGGGVIRSLNGNNSYGTWGSASFGYLASEVPHTGTLYGKQLTVTTDPITTGFTPGTTITGLTSGATGVVTNLQSSAAKIYYNQTSVADFQNGEDVSDGTNILTIAPTGVSDQKGYLIVANGFSSAPLPGASIQIAGDSSAYVVQSVSGTYVNSSSVLSIALAQEKLTGSPSGAALTIRYNYSQIRLTGHDFLLIGTGGVATTNYPNTPLQPPAQGNEVNEDLPGRVYYVSTDQDGNFRVGEYFRVDQATGTATLNANAFNLAGLTSLRLGSIGAQLGETINEFSSDATLGGNSNSAVPTEYAVKTYVDTRVPQALPTSVGQTGKVLTSAGATVSWTTLSVTPQWTTKVANYTAVAGDNLLCNTSGGSFNVTLPVSPSNNDQVAILDARGTFNLNPVTVKYNGAPIQGVPDDLVLNIQGASIALVYNSSFGWRLV